MRKPAEKRLRLTTSGEPGRAGSKLPALSGALARADFLRRVIEFGNTVHFSEGHISRRYKELIASYVSYLNRCPY
jgi:hypothetical protein